MSLSNPVGPPFVVDICPSSMVSITSNIFLMLSLVLLKDAVVEFKVFTVYVLQYLQYLPIL